MHCVILFRDSAGRLPTAQELRLCGFEVSTAALPPAYSQPLSAQRPEPALAAETAAPYGDSHDRPASPEPFHAEQAPDNLPELAAPQQAHQPGVDAFSTNGGA